MRYCVKIGIEMTQATRTRIISTKLLLIALVLWASISIGVQVARLWAVNAVPRSSIPPMIPEYPGANAMKTVKGYVPNFANNSEAWRVTFTTIDTPEQVQQFYKETLYDWRPKGTSHDDSLLITRYTANGPTACLEIQTESDYSTFTRVEIKSFAGNCPIGQFYPEEKSNQ